MEMGSKAGGIGTAAAGVHINGIHINGGVSFAESRPTEPGAGGAVGGEPNYSIKNVASYTYTYTYPDDIFYIDSLYL